VSRTRRADERVVDRGVAVRVEVAHDVADDARALRVRAIGAQPRVEHPVQDAAVHRLQAVADVRERARHDDRHRVVEEGALHLLLDLDGLDVAQRLLPVGHAFVSSRILYVSWGSLDHRVEGGGRTAEGGSDVEETDVLRVLLDEAPP
jgi:hypothetical protein